MNFIFFRPNVNKVVLIFVLSKILEENKTFVFETKRTLDLQVDAESQLNSVAMIV